MAKGTTIHRLSTLTGLISILGLTTAVPIVPSAPTGTAGGNRVPLESPEAQTPVSYTGYKLFKTDVEEQLFPVVDSLDVEVGVEVWSCRKDGKSSLYEMDLLTPPHAETEVRNVFTENNLRFQEVIGDLQSAINQETSDDEFFSWNRPAHPMTWQKYHSLDDMNQYLDYLASEYPQLVTVEEIGKSFENRSLRVAKVSTGGHSKPAMFIDGGIHAREWVSHSTAFYLLHRLVEFSWEEPQLLDRYDWYILPVANPDGYVYTRQKDRLWRKNRSLLSSAPFCQGVDLNRNFGYKWFMGGSSNQPCSSIYAGPKAFSEPETKAIGNFLLKHKDQMKVYLSLHAYSQMWMLPYSYTDKVKPHNYDDIYNVSTLAVQGIYNATGFNYSMGGVVELLYPASGSSGDYAHSIGIPYSFAIELRDKGRYGFILPKEQIEPTGYEVFQGLKAMAEGVYQKHKNPGGLSTGGS